MISTTITAIILIVSSFHAHAADQCIADCSGHSPGDKVPDPNNCNKYYLCMPDGTVTDHSIDCEAGQHFDVGEGDCKPGADCEPICKPQPCKVSCTDPGNFISHPKDCKKYYICNAALEATGPYECPSDKPYFNGKNCITDDSQCCKPSCKPYCNEGDVQIIDPENCHMYYICLNTGAPTNATHFSCPDGSNFDIASSRCKAGAPCVTLCGDDGVLTTQSPVHTTTRTVITDTPFYTSTGSSGNCLTSFRCPAGGVYAVCTNCDERYFYCSQGGIDGVIKRCADNKLFNPVPSFPYCVEASNCPYYPFF